MRRIFTTLFLCLAVSIVFAQAPEKFTYQAVVRNANNTLVANSQVGVRVSILQGSTSGSAVYVETQTATTNANGLMTLSIGGGSVQQGTFANIDWANGPFFLKTETDPNGGSNYTVTSTQQLLSVPYALYAKTAENGFSGDYNDLTNTPQNVSVFTNDAEYITNAQLTALLSNLNNRIDSLQTVLNILAPGVDVRSCPEAPPVTDFDGNVYQTVKIDNQCWTRDNLRSTHYADGTVISDYYLPYNGPQSYGYLYSWVTVMKTMPSSALNPSGVSGICPIGWHVPSDAEWTQLTDYVSAQPEYECGGNPQNIASALAAQTNWNSGTTECGPGYDMNLNNATGFSALPAGYFESGWTNYGPHDFGYSAYFWSSTADSSSYGIGRYLSYLNLTVSRFISYTSDV
ncbi:MAG: fibrobacter succinogenes major paralogous domain-containing protein, partial [Bacteroidales bacterium]|nr:fibrobacter succinogenes major paralogous domain-containing protein [Bacteroidales bacterium]